VLGQVLFFESPVPGGDCVIGVKQVFDKVQKMINFCMPMSDPADLLRLHGLPVTAQRLAVLRAVSRRPHSRADAIAEDVRAEIGTISRQAVYDALGILAEKGLIRRIQPAGSPALYEDRVGDNHHHLICRNCGKTVDVDCAVGDTPCLSAANDSGFEIDEAEVIYWGNCSVCRK
jgi:Fur family ferric uptake transcriptional regulator